jgi:hypothetical protein
MRNTDDTATPDISHLRLADEVWEAVCVRIADLPVPRPIDGYGLLVLESPAQQIQAVEHWTPQIPRQWRTRSRIIPAPRKANPGNRSSCACRTMTSRTRSATDCAMVQPLWKSHPLPPRSNGSPRFSPW